MAPAFSKGPMPKQVDWRPWIPNPNKTTSLIQSFSWGLISNYVLEYNLENFRMQHSADAPSRLSCVYAFEDEASCRQASQLYDWPLSLVRRFRLDEEMLHKVHRANMEVISWMRGSMKNTSWSGNDLDRILGHYWSGGGELLIEIPSFKNGIFERQEIHTGKLWEILIEGRLNIIGSLDQSVL
jgi:hypothetical protein